MTEKTKAYTDIKFPYQVISDVVKTFHRSLSPKNKTYVIKMWSIDYPEVSWKFDNEEQFRAEYTREEVVHAAISLHTAQSNLRITYSKDYKGRKTSSISINLPTIDKIEKVLSVFDENYEKYREMPKEAEDTQKGEVTTQKEPEHEIPLPQYKLEAILPSTLVDRRIIANLEKYIQQRINQLDIVKTPTPFELDFLKPTYTLTISDSEGTLKMDTISLFSKDIFDDDTSSVNLSYGKLLGSNPFEIDVTFRPDRYASKLKISYKGENARDIVESIRIGIFNILKENKTNHSLYHSPWSQSLLSGLIALALLLSFPNLLITGKPSWLAIAISSVITFLFFYFVPYLKPYTTFDNKKSRSFRGWNKWLIEAILAALLGWVILTLIPNIFPLP